MSYISPILSSKLNNKQPKASSSKAQHQKVYENLTQHANDVKPNEAKAKLVEETTMQSIGSYFKDLKQDTKNFFTAAKTGKMNDNSLGRINDLGLKAGGILIATFLAANAKTKTDAIMKFVGSGAFFASMSLWPKLFINLPAKLVHGFDVGQKYISAQGDKKDFFLDNQFLPWDAYPDEKLEKIGKHNKIDIHEENGKEKIQRKMQKVALQNRTLWMATAGFATPLMTALFCDSVEPHIKNAVIKRDFSKAQSAITESATAESTIKTQMKEAASLAAQQTDESIAKIFENASYDDNFFNKLAETLDFSKIDIDDKDQLKPIQKFTSTGIESNTANALRDIYNRTELAIDKDTLTKVLNNHISTKETAGIFGNSNGKIIEEIADEFFKENEPKTLTRLNDLLQTKGIIETDCKGILADDGLKVDSKKFEEFVTDFYKNTVLPTRAKLKLYLEKAVNPIIGNKAESQLTYETSSVLQNILKNKNIRLNEDQIKILKTGSMEDGQQVLEQYIKNLTQNVTYGSEEYENLIKALTNAKPENKSIITDSLFTSLKNLINEVKPESTEANKELVEALTGKNDASLFESILPNYVQQQKTNLESFTSRMAICANFETRLKEGKITINGLDLNAKENKDLLEAARKIIYRGNQSLVANKANIQRANQKEVFKSGTEGLMNALFDKEAFKNEPDVVKNVAEGLLEQNGGQTEKYLRNLDITAQIKNAATNLSNNKAWKKVFVPMAIILAATTLLVQPLFGKIDKEFPEEKGGNK